MKLLILATDYPDLNGNIASYFIHTRCLFYLKEGIELEVLNFRAKENYTIDGVKVITLDEYGKCENKNYDLLISHAHNLRNHYKFLRQYGNNFKKYLFFFHGHEVLKINKDYSKPYDYMEKKLTFLRDIYDFIKLKVWHKFFIKYNEKSYYIFVSNWMKEMFFKNTKIKEETLDGHYFITYNSIDKEFENNNYDLTENKKYDFITIRGNLDGSKYCIDIVNQLAKQNPELKFLVVGKGKYFKINEKSNNIEWLEKYCNHDEIIKLLNQSKCALMPTRTDAQGLMMCEMATFGIPLITSDIPISHEVFDDFDNVEYIDNNSIENENILEKYNKILHKKKIQKNKKYFLDANCMNEVNIIKDILKK